MHRFGIWLCSALVTGSCAARPEPPPTPPPTVAAPATAPAFAPRVTACSAQPSTVYGDEPVVFQLVGEGSGDVEFDVLDQQQRSVRRDRSPVSGRVELPDLGSGDFSLRIVGSPVRCEVTVNRELSRATPAAR